MLFESTFVRSAGIWGAFYRIASTFTKDNTIITTGITIVNSEFTCN